MSGSRCHDADLIAPCGLNCRLCRAYVRERNACPGCRGDDGFKPKTRAECRIKNCRKIPEEGIEYCSGCSGFPCKALSHLDNRYRANYGMSVIDNLITIGRLGIKEFVEREKEKWHCPECGRTLCVHKEQCPSCGHTWRS